MEWIFSRDGLQAFIDTFGIMLMGIGVVTGGEALRRLVGWKTDHRVETLKRRLADVEALRRLDRMPLTPVDPGVPFPVVEGEVERAEPPMIRTHLGDPLEEAPR